MKKTIAIGATLILTLAMSVTVLGADTSEGKVAAKLARAWRAGHTIHRTLEREMHGHNSVKHSTPEHDNDCTYVDNDYDGICDNSGNHNTGTQCTYADNNYDGICDNTGIHHADMNCSYVDTNSDGVCDNTDNHCAYVDADNDGICDNAHNHTSDSRHCVYNITEYSGTADDYETDNSVTGTSNSNEISNMTNTTNSTHHNEGNQSGRHHNSQGYGGRHHR